METVEVQEAHLLYLISLLEVVWVELIILHMVLLMVTVE